MKSGDDITGTQWGDNERKGSIQELTMRLCKEKALSFNSTNEKLYLARMNQQYYIMKDIYEMKSIGKYEIN